MRRKVRGFSLRVTNEELDDRWETIQIHSKRKKISLNNLIQRLLLLYARRIKI